MSRHNRYIFIAFLLGIFFLAGTGSVSAEEVANGNAALTVATSVIGGTFDLVGTILSPLGNMIMQLMSLVTLIAGVILNASIFYTVVQMAENFGHLPAIDQAWATIRDVANMGFIFVLLYASIMTIIGKENDARGLIVKMIIAAILINFSLFFTKVVIDIANLLALTFYKAIAPEVALSSGNFMNGGISNSFMSALKISSLYSTDNLTGANLFITTILSSVVLLITAFIFFAVAIMFITRYVILIFVLILSPIAFVSSILPGLNGLAKQWREALIGQAFFAPIYFLLTWVTILVVRNISDVAFAGSSGFGNAFTAAGDTGFSPGVVPTLVNFAVVIGFLIFSLITAKSVAGKTGAGMTKWMTGAAGGLTLGMAGRLGRSTIGDFGSKMADSESLKKKEQEGGIKGAMARLGLAAGRKTSKATFDARGSSLYEGISGATGISLGKPIGKGGFQQQLKDEAKRQKEEADALKPSDLVISQAEKELDDAKKVDESKLVDERDEMKARTQQALNDARAERRNAAARGATPEELSKIDERINKAQEEFNQTTDLKTYKKYKIKTAQARVDELKGVSEDDARKREIRDIRVRERVGEKRAKELLKEREDARFLKVQELVEDGMSESDAKKEAERLGVGWAPKEVESAASKRKKAYADRLLNPNLRDFGFVKGSVLDKVLMTSKANKQSAMEIRKSIKDKKPADKLAEELSKAKEAGEDSAGGSAPAPTPTPPPPTPGPATS